MRSGRERTKPRARYPPVRFTSHQELVAGDNVFTELYDYVQHLICIVQPAWGACATHARQVHVDTFPSRAICENRFQATGHHVVIDAKPVDREHGVALATRLVINVQIAHFVYHGW